MFLQHAFGGAVPQRGQPVAMRQTRLSLSPAPDPRRARGPVHRRVATTRGILHDCRVGTDEYDSDRAGARGRLIHPLSRFVQGTSPPLFQLADGGCGMHSHST